MGIENCFCESRHYCITGIKNYFRGSLVIIVIKDYGNYMIRKYFLFDNKQNKPILWPPKSNNNYTLEQT